MFREGSVGELCGIGRAKSWLSHFYGMGLPKRGVNDDIPHPLSGVRWMICHLYISITHSTVKHSNSRQFPREQPILSHHGGLHGRSVHVFGLIHHPVSDLFLQKTSGLQAITGELDYEN